LSSQIISSTENTPQPPPPSPPVLPAEVKREPEDIIAISSPERQDRSRSFSRLVEMGESETQAPECRIFVRNKILGSGAGEGHW